MVFHKLYILISNCFLMSLRCFQYDVDASSATLNNDLVIKFNNGPMTGKYFVILIEFNKLKKAVSRKTRKGFHPNL